MDITGRISGYRGVAIRCPGCAEPMTQKTLGEAEVDVCNACGGLWVDWFDGEVRNIATEALSHPSHAPMPPGQHNEPRAIGACPRCTRQLARERYVIKAAVKATDPKDGSDNVTVAQETGAELLRCEECAGAFVSRTSAETLATLPADEEPPPSQAVGGPALLEPLPWQRLLLVLKRILGLG
jgi:Zn-finger nucleic acid-binding protein